MPAPEPELCPFDKTQVRAENCKWGRSCPWFLYEGNQQCYCAVGVDPEHHLARVLAARLRERSS
jgi:hypothetical protein